jgi:hypothetical protein
MPRIEIGLLMDKASEGPGTCGGFDLRQLEV